MRNTLFYGDNLDILRDFTATESVDLIYLHLPFNFNRNYNVLFKEEVARRLPLNSKPSPTRGSGTVPPSGPTTS